MAMKSTPFDTPASCTVTTFGWDKSAIALASALVAVTLAPGALADDELAVGLGELGVGDDALGDVVFFELLHALELEAVDAQRVG